MAGKKKILIFVLIFVVLLAIGGFVLLSRKSNPGSNKLLAYMERAYGKDFEIIEEFTYISYTDGEPDVQREIQCPAVELQDKENSEIRCFAYAYPLEGGGWTYENNYSRKILLYCIQQENLMIENEDECSSVTSFSYPCLILENTDETAQKLQNMVIQFNEFYQYNDKYFHDSGSEMFEVEGSIYMKSILAGHISDRWLEETGNFCYDTPIEKYKAFLEELEQEQEGDQKDDASLVLLNQVRDDIQLYGVTFDTASAMLLYVDGEKVFIDHSFQNFYAEYPRVYCGDLDNDGREEIAISYRTATGSPGSWYGLSVCDYKDGWKVWDYESWQQDIEALIRYQWDESSGTVLFLDESGSVLTEIELPEWTENYPYTGKVDFGNDIRFNAEKMKLAVEPWILLENSLPYDPIVILFDIHYENGGFAIEVTDILDREEYYNQGVWNQDENAREETEEDSQQRVEEEYVSSMEEIEALGLSEDMLAFWLVLTGRKPFVSVKEDYQEFYWDEYCWRFGKPTYPYKVSKYMLVDMNGDGAEEVVMYCMPESTQVLYYEDGVVYNYQFAFRGMKRIHTNGIYEGSNGAANTIFFKLTELNSHGYEEEILAFCDGGNYEIGGVEVSQQEFSNYALQTIESVDLAEEFTEDMLDTYLLGDLSEEERFIVEHIPVDERKAVTMNEPGKGSHKMMFWLVANSGWEFTSTDDRDYREQEFYLEDFRRFLGDSELDYQVERFALVDLDGDGRDEMILYCYPDAIQVLYMADEMYHPEFGAPYGRVVYSYQWKAGDITGIRTNGIYCRYGGSSRFAYYRITEFNAEGYTDELLARSFNGHYEVEGCEVSEEEFYDFIQSLEEERIEFYDFTEENLRKYLLGE